VVSFHDGHKQVQRGWSEKLAGPWTFEPDAIIPVGAADDFDAKHTDAVTGYYLPIASSFCISTWDIRGKRKAARSAHTVRPRRLRRRNWGRKSRQKAA